MGKREKGNGTAPSKVLRGGRRDRQPDRGGRAAAAYVATLAQPADSRPGGRGRCGAVQSKRTRRRIDGGGQGVSRSRATRARAGRRRNGSGAPRVAAGEEGVRAGLPD